MQGFHPGKSVPFATAQKQFNLASADELDVETLVARMETEALACHRQLIGPLQFGDWTRKW